MFVTSVIGTNVANLTYLYNTQKFRNLFTYFFCIEVIALSFHQMTTTLIKMEKATIYEFQYEERKYFFKCIYVE